MHRVDHDALTLRVVALLAWRVVALLAWRVSPDLEGCGTGTPESCLVHFTTC